MQGVVTMTLFVLAFPNGNWEFSRPPNTAKQGKTQNDKSTLFYPMQGGFLTGPNGTAGFGRVLTFPSLFPYFAEQSFIHPPTLEIRF